MVVAIAVVVVVAAVVVVLMVITMHAVRGLEADGDVWQWKKRVCHRTSICRIMLVNVVAVMLPLVAMVVDLVALVVVVEMVTRVLLE